MFFALIINTFLWSHCLLFYTVCIHIWNFCIGLKHCFFFTTFFHEAHTVSSATPTFAIPNSFPDPTLVVVAVEAAAKHTHSFLSTAQNRLSSTKGCWILWMISKDRFCLETGFNISQRNWLAGKKEKKMFFAAVIRHPVRGCLCSIYRVLLYLEYSRPLLAYFCGISSMHRAHQLCTANVKWGRENERFGSSLEDITRNPQNTVGKDFRKIWLHGCVGIIYEE